MGAELIGPSVQAEPPVLALVAHDGRKEAMARFAVERRDALSRFRLVATGTTGGLVAERTGLPVERLLSGPMGGDQQIGAGIAERRIDALIFLVDPLSPHPHDVDVKALTRLALVHDVPLALDLSTAALVLDGLAARERLRAPVQPDEAEAGFALDPRLEAEGHLVADLPLCRVRLVDDARFPWLVLVPRRPGLVEIADLEPPLRAILRAEVDTCAAVLRGAVRCDKLNVAALGNLVAQLHVHVIARRRDDAAWPAPTFGFGQRQPRATHERIALLARLAAGLAAPSATVATPVLDGRGPNA